MPIGAASSYATKQRREDSHYHQQSSCAGVLGQNNRTNTALDDKRIKMHYSARQSYSRKAVARSN
eukprot:scaffold521256_cov19-Prasinocladus_malaysianus.AAC.1